MIKTILCEKISRKPTEINGTTAERVSILYKETWLSMLDFPDRKTGKGWTQDWKEGDKKVVSVWRNGDFINFGRPKQEDILYLVMELKEKVDKLTEN